MYRPNYLCDLHGHTNLSDGNDTYQEFIDTAAALGMKVVAITDHDVTPLTIIEVNGKKISPVEYASSKNVHLLLGIEYSCDTYVDDVHIVGLGCDWTDENFKIEEARMKRSKIEGYKKLTEVLTDNGMHISWEELLENKGNPRNPEEIQRKHIFEEIAKKGYSKTWQEAKLMVKNNPIYNVRREKIDPVKAIEVIHNAGGIAILAHPYLIDEVVKKGDKKITRQEYIAHLLEAGLDGIEAAYTYSKTSYKGKQTEEQIEKEVRQLYGDSVKIISGGSDYHNDAKKGVKNARMLGEKGVTWEYFQGNEYLNRLICIQSL
ncbi:MAG: 3,5-nucleoside bisphosphate phosphatase [Clostridiales bacterium]|jgi:predicted metal-dependent phosphoesterase TrpH|nr:3,5-nucleoside bisphosphate phosphatase [Clostridiales bacterium]MDK2932781.1 3,5-nucleoside bisphosphate phosphatase [Clostridiales bacterium]